MEIKDVLYEIAINKTLEVRRAVGVSPHTAKFKPWNLIAYSAFSGDEKSRAFKKYLKTYSVKPLHQNSFNGMIGKGERAAHFEKTLKTVLGRALVKKRPWDQF